MPQKCTLHYLILLKIFVVVITMKYKKLIVITALSILIFIFWYINKKDSIESNFDLYDGELNSIISENSLITPHNKAIIYSQNGKNDLIDLISKISNPNGSWKTLKTYKVKSDSLLSENFDVINVYKSCILLTSNDDYKKLVATWLIFCKNTEIELGEYDNGSIIVNKKLNGNWYLVSFMH